MSIHKKTTHGGGQGIFRPNFSQIPNFFLDELLPSLSGTETKVFLIIARQTFGWHKETDKISLSQFILKTGSSKNSIKQSLKNLLERKLIIVKTKGSFSGELTEYQINTDFFKEIQTISVIKNGTNSEALGQKLTQPWVKKCPSPGSKNAPALGQKLTPQNKLYKIKLNKNKKSLDKNSSGNNMVTIQDKLSDEFLSEIFRGSAPGVIELVKDYFSKGGSLDEKQGGRLGRALDLIRSNVEGIKNQ
jgi:phage replication O-like protein O